MSEYPKPCGLCPSMIESADDLDWHGYGNCIEITDEMWAQWEKEAAMIEPFDDWWERDGKFFDPDTDDVPWFDKRRFLAEYAYMKAIAQTRNYVCDEAVEPTKVTFANGRVVTIELGEHGAYLNITPLSAQPERPAKEGK